MRLSSSIVTGDKDVEVWKRPSVFREHVAKVRRGARALALSRDGGPDTVPLAAVRRLCDGGPTQEGVLADEGVRGGASRAVLAGTASTGALRRLTVVALASCACGAQAKLKRGRAARTA